MNIPLAERHHPNAQNITVQTGISFWNLIQNHKFMHNCIEIWERYIFPNLIFETIAEKE